MASEYTFDWTLAQMREYVLQTDSIMVSSLEASQRLAALWQQLHTQGRIGPNFDQLLAAKDAWEQEASRAVATWHENMESASMLKVPLALEGGLYHDDVLRACLHFEHAGTLLLDGIRHLDAKLIVASTHEQREGIKLCNTLRQKWRQVTHPSAQTQCPT
jgi:hypothetical protein